MKIGLYFGTFNPIHIGHLIIANHMAEHSELEQIWLVVTPHNPHKEKNTLLDDYQRLHLAHLATEEYPKIKPSDIEFKLPQPNYTVNTLVYLKEKFPQHEFSLIMGEDNLKSLHKWKNYEYILENHAIYIYPRLSNKTETSLRNAETSSGDTKTISGDTETSLRNAETSSRDTKTISGDTETSLRNAETSSVLTHPRIHKIDAPIVEISSTFIRDSIKNKKNIRPLLSEKVWEYIDHNNFYKK
jgi:nicotinate-nucleotide adenylyltransferase